MTMWGEAGMTMGGRGRQESKPDSSGTSPAMTNWGGHDKLGGGHDDVWEWPGRGAPTVGSRLDATRAEALVERCGPRRIAADSGACNRPGTMVGSQHPCWEARVAGEAEPPDRGLVRTGRRKRWPASRGVENLSGVTATTHSSHATMATVYRLAEARPTVYKRSQASVSRGHFNAEEESLGLCLYTRT